MTSSAHASAVHLPVVHSAHPYTLEDLVRDHVRTGRKAPLDVAIAAATEVAS